MMQGHSYTEESLIEAINKHFGAEAKFCTCHASDMTARELVEFFKARGKFTPSQDGFTVDTTQICNH